MAEDDNFDIDIYGDEAQALDIQTVPELNPEDRIDFDDDDNAQYSYDGTGDDHSLQSSKLEKLTSTCKARQRTY